MYVACALTVLSLLGLLVMMSDSRVECPYSDLLIVHDVVSEALMVA